MIAFRDISIGTGGELSCSSCFRAAERAPRPLADIVAEAARIVDEWDEHAPGPNIGLVGYEPFAHPELPALIAATHATGIERLRLRTDGGALSQPGNAEGVFGAGVRHLELIVLAGDPATHDRLAGASGLFAATAQGAAAYASVARGSGERAVLTGYVPMCKHNAGDVSAAVAHLASLGASAVQLALAPGIAESHADAVRAALDTATVNAMAGWVTGDGAASFGVYASGPWSAL